MAIHALNTQMQHSQPRVYPTGTIDQALARTDPLIVRNWGIAWGKAREDMVRTLAVKTATFYDREQKCEVTESIGNVITSGVLMRTRMGYCIQDGFYSIDTIAGTGLLEGPLASIRHAYDPDAVKPDMAALALLNPQPITPDVIPVLIRFCEDVLEIKRAQMIIPRRHCRRGHCRH